jgi:purine nucleoside permease
MRTMAFLWSTLLCSLAAGAQPPAGGETPVAVKVLIINLFGLEAAPWISALKPTRDIAVRGLPADYPTVKCTADAVCQMTTGMGHANAAASVMAVMLSDRFDLRRTYFLIAGIAGIDPALGTLGSVAWARYLVDVGIAHEIDARELPKNWSEGYFGVMTDGPDQVPRFDYRTEAFQLDEALLRQALALSRAVPLQDAGDLRAYRRHYREAAARQPPAVIQCDTLSGDTWWSGRRLGEHARHWTKLLTGGKGVYCTTQQEDNAVLNVLTRGAAAKLVDLRRVADLRAGADFDRPYPGQSALATLVDQRRLNDSAPIAADNLVRAGMPLIDAIVTHWDEWQHGVPAAAP